MCVAGSTANGDRVIYHYAPFAGIAPLAWSAVLLLSVD